jgi:hypothetical protein
MQSSMRYLGLTLLFIGLTPLSAGPNSLDCVKDMEIPQKHTLVAYTTGNVEAVVTVGSYGRLKSVDIKSPNIQLRTEVEFYLRYHTVYSPSCRGQRVNFSFTYAIEGPLADELSTTLHFLPPNRFLVVSRPVRPIIDYAIPPSQAKQP